MDNPILFRPAERAAQCRLRRFASFVGRQQDTYYQLHKWSVEHPAEFWSQLWDFFKIPGKKGRHVFSWRQGDDFYLAQWFREAQINYSEIFSRQQDERRIALVYVSEAGDRVEINQAELHRSILACAAALKANGIGKGDRVAGILTNCPEAIICMLATARLGAVWSSCSPDFGLGGLTDRLGQVEPKLLFVTERYSYKGKKHNISQKIVELRSQLAADTRIVRIEGEKQEKQAEPDEKKSLETTWESFIQQGSILPPPPIEPVPFDHPLVVMFSSGTTGLPKCIIHSHGGVLLKHLCELGLHIDLDETDSLFYFTTCGWMMWNWMASALLFGTRLVLYDGHPFYPRADRLPRLWQAEELRVVGLSAGLLEQMQNGGVALPKGSLPHLRMLCSTGSPLSPAGFDYVYATFKPDVHLASISGGTDILGCFVLGVPTLPVRRGEIQAACLGMDVAIYDETGKAVIGEKGELVCRKPFPSAPISLGFNDEDYSAYKKSYFDRFAGIWTHGDYAEQTPEGAFIIYGRSDATLNPGGVRMGSAEIYRPLEQISEVTDCLAVAQNWEKSSRIILFVVLAPQVTLDAQLRQKICDHLRRTASPRHIPAKIIAVPEVPRTLNGKLCELAVHAVIHGHQVTNRTALANPASLAAFQNIAELNTP